ncbi:hypothetical protein IEO21_04931 [Rhodonia placenta]|uniref:Uncharacterized protein n=2 Tax=Rhodonia placenta TaxID=104341 RepID=A0A1X6N0Y4_9APHY|nr:hypothetical protein POSPLADRAFT_1033838 [Postia placenta MAD-698-R-SB12]KAF9814773.1 hypothetical protein IEO21_04931 [Postia placenta]OSX62150.1 hypothetical protein POSPLADRAFT_1033838 [Postia placenta MAD-698-R-SB12]
MPVLTTRVVTGHNKDHEVSSHRKCPSVYVIRKKQNLYFVPKLGEILVNTSHAIGPDGKSSTMVNEFKPAGTKPIANVRRDSTQFRPLNAWTRNAESTESSVGNIFSQAEQ